MVMVFEEVGVAGKGVMMAEEQEVKMSSHLLNFQDA
jgi:hypothetical protein